MMTDEHSRFIAALFYDYAPKLSRKAYRLLYDEEKARELVQDVFILASDKVELLLEHPYPYGWLIKTLDYMILRERQRLATGAYPAPASSLAETLANQEPPDCLDEILPLALAEEDKQILRWRFEERMSYAEIGAKLNLSPAAAGMRLARAKERCRELLKK